MNFAARVEFADSRERKSTTGFHSEVLVLIRSFNASLLRLCEEQPAWTRANVKDMAVIRVCGLWWMGLLCLAARSSRALGQDEPRQVQSVSDFPPGFRFGVSSAAYQYEGAVKEGGRGPSVWDSASHMADIIQDNSTGDVADDHYHRYQEDIGLMADLGVHSYRFSISWSRIFPDGRGPVANPEGIAFYNSLIDNLLSRGIEPFACLFHFDLPEALQDEFGGWLSRQIIPLFRSFAETCFAAFGDRVKYWFTINEIHNFAINFANIGCRVRSGSCGTLSSSTRVYNTAHCMLLAHASTVELYRAKFQAKQGGQVGLIVDAQWFVPYSNSPEDIEAAERMKAFQVRWTLDPIYYGRYPEVLVRRLGNLLPKFTETEVQSLLGSVDFLGVNHYTTHYALDRSNSTDPKLFDLGVATSGSREGVPIGPAAASPWLNIVPYGIHEALNYIRVHYNRPIVYITENGVDEENDPTSPLEAALQDSHRIKYHLDYLSYVNAAIREGCDVRGYFIWSLLDNFEWDDGLAKRFGLFYVDYVHNLTRHAKHSAIWYREFLRPLPALQRA